MTISDLSARAKNSREMKHNVRGGSISSTLFNDVSRNATLAEAKVSLEFSYVTTILVLTRMDDVGKLRLVRGRDLNRG